MPDRVGQSGDSLGSRLEQVSTPVQGRTVWTFTLTDRDAISWDRERLDMLEDAFWLVRQALAGRTEGPLTLPRTGLPAPLPASVSATPEGSQGSTGSVG